MTAQRKGGREMEIDGVVSDLVVGEPDGVGVLTEPVKYLLASAWSWLLGLAVQFS